MIRGAIKSFEHDHFFTRANGEATEMRDLLVFHAPLGPLGRLVDWLVLAGYLQRFLVARNLVIKQAAESTARVAE
jgi:ligand-binding SRPBCC domain-containing protein